MRVVRALVRLHGCTDLSEPSLVAFAISTCTVKHVLSGHPKIDKTKILMTNGSLMKVKNVAECSALEHSAILLTCIKR